MWAWALGGMLWLLAGGAAAESAGAPTPCASAAITDRSYPADGPDASAPAQVRAAAALFYLQRAVDYEGCSDLASARRNYDLAVALDPGNYQILALRGHFLYTQNDYSHAIADWSEVIRHEDRAPPGLNLRAVHGDRALAYVKLGMNTEALDDLDAALDRLSNPQLDPATTLRYRERRGALLLDAGQYEKAATDFGFVAMADPSRWEDEYHLGEAELKLSRFEAAIKALAEAERGRAADHGPEAVRLKARLEETLGETYAARKSPGDVSRARQLFAAARADDPEDEAAAAALAQLPAPPPPPRFDGREPSLAEVVMPASVTDLDRDLPAPFCGPVAKNNYLESIRDASSAINANLTAISRYVGGDASQSGTLEAERARYDASDLITYEEKIDDLAAFDAEIKKYNDMFAALSAKGQQLLRFYDRVLNGKAAFASCKDDSPASRP